MTQAFQPIAKLRQFGILAGKRVLRIRQFLIQASQHRGIAFARCIRLGLGTAVHVCQVAIESCLKVGHRRVQAQGFRALPRGFGLGQRFRKIFLPLRMHLFAGRPHRAQFGILRGTRRSQRRDFFPQCAILWTWCDLAGRLGRRGVCVLVVANDMKIEQRDGGRSRFVLADDPELQVVLSVEPLRRAV